MITPDVLPLPFLIRMTPQLQPPPAAAPMAEPITHPLFGVDPNAGQQQQQPPMMGGMMPQQHHQQQQQQPGGYGVSKGIFTSLFSLFTIFLLFRSRHPRWALQFLERCHRYLWDHPSPSSSPNSNSMASTCSHSRAKWE